MQWSCQETGSRTLVSNASSGAIEVFRAEALSHPGLLQRMPSMI